MEHLRSSLADYHAARRRMDCAMRGHDTGSSRIATRVDGAFVLRSWCRRCRGYVEEPVMASPSRRRESVPSSQPKGYLFPH